MKIKLTLFSILFLTLSFAAHSGLQCDFKEEGMRVSFFKRQPSYLSLEKEDIQNLHVGETLYMKVSSIQSPALFPTADVPLVVASIYPHIKLEKMNSNSTSFSSISIDVDRSSSPFLVSPKGFRVNADVVLPKTNGIGCYSNIGSGF